MTTTTNTAVNDSLAAAGFGRLKVALEIAMEHGGFDAVLAVCDDLKAGVAKSDKTSGSYAETEWRGLAFLETRFPGSTLKLAKYYKAAGIPLISRKGNNHGNN